MRRLAALTLLILLWPTAATAQRLEIGIGPLVHRRLGLQVKLNRWLDARYQFDFRKYDMFQNDERFTRHLAAIVFKLWR